MTVSACLANQSAARGVRENTVLREKNRTEGSSSRTNALDVDQPSHSAARGK